MIRVYIADDHRLFRQGVANLLKEQPNLEVIGQASDGLAAVREVAELRPDVVLMDVHMPNLSGTEATRAILKQQPDASIVMLTVSDEDQDLLDAVRAGARGYLLKNVDARDLIDAIHRAHAGEAMLSPAMAAKLMEGFRDVDRRAIPPAEEVLTDREREILAELATGATNQEIAERLTISVHTVKTHVRHILSKLDVDNRAQAAAYAARQGLVARDRD